MARDHLVSVRLSDEEHAHLLQLVEVHQTGRSTLLRDLVLSAPLRSVQIAPAVAAPRTACPMTTGQQYAGLTADERVLAEADPHMPLCDEPNIADCAECLRWLRTYRRVLEALVAAGRLLPVPLETRTEWGYLHPGRPLYPCDTEEYADVNQRIGGGSKQRREVQVFADGRELVGTWVPVDPDTKEGP